MSEADTRALDAWLTEHLFGWDAEACTCGMCIVNYYCPQHGDHSPLPPYAYSTTGDGMLIVLEAMRERGWHGMLDYGFPGDGYWVEAGFTRLVEPAEGRGPFDNAPAAHHDSLPAAVALAAKAALEAETP